MTIDLRGLPIAITGASSGIGAATAIACARAGMPVALGARRTDKLDRVKDIIEQAGGRAISVEVDVQDPEASAAFIETTRTAFGSVYSVFANAGYGSQCSLENTTDADIRAMFETNVFGSLNVIRPALRMMKEKGNGHILWCSSCLSVRPVPFYSVYTATKATQHHMAHSMRAELLGTGVHVSSVHPVGTRTEFFDKSNERSDGPSLAKADGKGQTMLQPPERVASAVVRCLKRPKAEAWTSAGARFLFPLSLLTPGLAGAVMRRMIKARTANTTNDKADD